ncbi:hypothetical protein [Streptomyces sp. NPDC019890]|uniref:hypothetical protein n=1 Tax=Streptomyces sp. NPDC019890 TaxID=3365064 RepID=UPI00384E27BF
MAAEKNTPSTASAGEDQLVALLRERCEGVTVLGEGAYINTGLIVPHRKRPGRPLLSGKEKDDAEPCRVPARVGHAFDRTKNYKIIRSVGSAAAGCTARVRE